MKKFYLLSVFSVVVFLTSCKIQDQFLYADKTQNISKSKLSGTDFFQLASSLNSSEREKKIEEVIINGNFPEFMNKFIKINVSGMTSNGKKIKGYYFVSRDYLMIGTNEDFFRIPMQPKTAQKIADKFGCFLPTKKICDDVYKAAKIKLEPIPLTQNRDSLSTFFYHNQLIERQRKRKNGLIAGIKKDVIISSSINKDKRTHREAIYGWHKLDGNPIQPVYTGHVDWYVDYSHGIRLVSRKIYIEGKEMDYIDVMKNPETRFLITDEPDEGLDFYMYPYE